MKDNLFTVLTDIALEKAQAILSSECSPIGLMASPEGYPHVWARDSVITALGALLSPGHESCLMTSLHTLASSRSQGPSPAMSAWPPAGWTTPTPVRSIPTSGLSWATFSTTASPAT
jgi:hypothetical protein